MLPLLMAAARRGAPIMLLPFAAVIGFIGYNMEGWLSDKYTPFAPSIQEDRMKRLANETEQVDPTKVEKLRLSENVLERNLSPSLQTKS